MKKVMCDNHPDKPADYTFSIRILPLGHRPMFTRFGESSKAKYVDLCVDCTKFLEGVLDAPTGR